MAKFTSCFFNNDAKKPEQSDAHQYVNFKDEFNSKYHDELKPSSSHSVTACFAHFSSAPSEYKEVTTWLTMVVGYEYSDGFNDTLLSEFLEKDEDLDISKIRLNTSLITAALIACNRFAIKDNLNPKAAIALTKMVKTFAQTNNHDLTSEPDFEGLTEYCNMNKIVIPESIEHIINDHGMKHVA